MSAVNCTGSVFLRPFAEPGGEGRQAHAASGSERGAEAVLGNNTVFCSRVDFSHVFLRAERYRLQRFARSVLPRDDRIGVCHRLKNPDHDISVLRRDERARYSGLMVCASVWKCPVCAARIATERAREIETLLEWAGRRGYRCVFVTLTAHHSRDDELRGLVRQVSKARSAVRQGRSGQALRERCGLVGTVSGLEVTYGESNGWHPHYHEIWICRGDVFGIGPEIERQWGAACSRLGLRTVQPWGCRVEGVDLLSGARVAGYVAKFGTAAGLSAELAGGATTKRGTGERWTPVELLQRAAGGCGRAKGLWLEYVRAFVGRCQLRWSKGLKGLSGVAELDDDDLAEAGQDALDEMLGRLDDGDFVLICRYRQRAAVLAAAELDGWAGVQELLGILRERRAGELTAYLERLGA